MIDTYEVGERVSVKVPIQGLKNRYGNVEDVRMDDRGQPQFLVAVHGYRLWCTWIELSNIR